MIAKLVARSRTIGTVSAKLVAESDLWCRPGHKIYARNIDTGDVSYLGFIAEGDGTLAHINLANGTYDVEARPCKYLWDDCRAPKYLRLIMKAGVSQTVFPAVQNLEATDKVYGKPVTWQWVQRFGQTSPDSFGIWYGSSPVDTSGSADYTLVYKSTVRNYQHVYGGTDTHVAVRAFNGTDKSVNSEIALPTTAALTGPAEQWIEE